MYSKEQRRIAIETFIRFDHSYADTIAELGYPDRHSLRNWWREYRETGEVPVPKHEREPKYTLEMRREAVEHYLSHGKRLARTMRALGYPKSREVLGDWIDEIAPGQRRRRGPNPRTEAVPTEKKVQVVAELEARTGPAEEVAERHKKARHAIHGHALTANRAGPYLDNSPGPPSHSRSVRVPKPQPPLNRSRTYTFPETSDS